MMALDGKLTKTITKVITIMLKGTGPYLTNAIATNPIQIRTGIGKFRGSVK